MFICRTMRTYVGWLTHLFLSASIWVLFGSGAMAVEEGTVFKPHVIYWYNHDYYVTPPQFVEPIDDTQGVLSKEPPDENTIPNIWVLLLDGMESIKSFPRAEEFDLDVEELSRKPRDTITDIQDRFLATNSANQHRAWIRIIVVDIEFYADFLPPECLDDLIYRTIVRDGGTLSDFEECRRPEA